MNLPEIKSYEDRAVDTVVSVLNKAREAIGERQTLKQLAASRDFLTPQAKVSLTSLECPLAITSEKLIKHTIEKKWHLTDTFLYDLKYLGSSKNKSSEYFYFEAMFSQPTAAYPIPQATASVFFRVEDKLIEPPKVKGVPMMSFRIEGHRSDHDVRYITLVPDWILAVIQMKVKLFQRVEELVLF